MNKTIKISSIVVDDELYPRDRIDPELVKEYVEDLDKGAKFPDIVVFQDGSKLYLGDGRHRVEAFRKLERKEIAAEIRTGTKRDAILYAVGANYKHGIRRSREDKRKAVMILLKDTEWQQWSVNDIAAKCKVGWHLVQDVKDELGIAATSERKFERGGKVHTQKTNKIGKREKRAPESTPAVTVIKMIDLVSEARNGFDAEHKPQLAKRMNDLSNELQDILGKATGAKCRLERGLRQPINVYERPRQDGIELNEEFAKKKLCHYSLGVGLICGHQCTYCSTPSMLYQQKAFVDIQQTSFKRGYAIIDPNSAERIKNHLPKNLTAEHVIQLSTIDDAWSPEAQEYNLGRKIMKVLLEETPAQIRVLTKNAEVAKDFDLFAKYGNRVIVGLSTGMPRDKDYIATRVEPNASSITERFAALKTAYKMGLRTYGMLCPCLPLIADSKKSLTSLFDEVLACDVEDIWIENVNPRGKALVNTEDALRRCGLIPEADAIKCIRKASNRSKYVRDLIENVISIASKKKVLDKTHFLLYPSSLTAEDSAALKKYEKGIIWLEKDTEDDAADPKPA